jgi:GNAT superfamily N-acetyltransferase
MSSVYGSTEAKTERDLTFSLSEHVQLKDGRRASLAPLDRDNAEQLSTVHDMLNTELEVGDKPTYPQRGPMSAHQFRDYFLSAAVFVVHVHDSNDNSNDNSNDESKDVEAKDESKDESNDESKDVGVKHAGGVFYVKPNYPGRCSHVANAGFIVHERFRGNGVGRFMAEHVERIAVDLGYRALMYNLIFESNVASIRLWTSREFTQIGRVPEAAQLDDGSFVDALQFYKKLV